MEKKLSNVKEVRNEILDIMTKLRANKISLEFAKTQINAAGKATGNAVAEMLYNKYIGEKKRIDYFEYPEKEVIKK